MSYVSEAQQINVKTRAAYENSKVSGTSGVGVPIAVLPAEFKATTSADHARVIVQRVASPYKEDKEKFSALIHNAFTGSECEVMIQMAETHGLSGATPRVLEGHVQTAEEMREQRNSHRIPFESHELARWLFSRIAPFVPQRVLDMTPYSLHERCRVVKYTPGMYFKAHNDGYKRRSENDRSFFSFLLYLNDGYEHGRTQFYDPDNLNATDWAPRQGSVLVFDHTIWHGSSALTNGVKYALKSEVMYRA